LETSWSKSSFKQAFLGRAGSKGSSAAGDVEQYFPTIATNDFESVFFRSKSSVSGTPKQFMRVRVQLQQ